MPEFVIGRRAKPAAVDNLVAALRKLNAPDGIGYVGYPAVTVDGETRTIDVLFTSTRFGVVIFDPVDGEPSDGWSEVEDRQTQLVLALKSRLMAHKALTKKRDLAFEINVITYSPQPIKAPNAEDIVIASPQNLEKVLSRLEPLATGLIQPVNAAIQSVSTIKPRKKRISVKRADSRGAVLKTIEKEIANLDRWQRRGAIETPEGPQRLRGLAGSGKTVVLALKAAYLHGQHPEWTIALTFQTRSLYQQFKDLVGRFYFDQQSDSPDWGRLRILHAWGSSSEPGFYSEIVSSLGLAPQSFATAKALYGSERAFGGLCAEVLRAENGNRIKPLFDVVLIDEAQDLPPDFFRMAYKASHKPKRVVWAYDELQNLGKYSMAPPSELFGTDKNDKPLVELRNIEGRPQQDVILPVCYRNTPWALATAHALGFGIYRKAGICQFFDDPGLWNQIGYEVVEGDLRPGSEVTLARKADCSPEFFGELLEPKEAVQVHEFSDEEEQHEWVIQEIKKNLKRDELEPDDILLILPDPFSVRTQAGPLMAALRSEGLSAHLAGVTSSRDEIFIRDSIAISGIFRAKGNEAPMVYILNSDYCFDGTGITTKRNTLFTAITRSRAWVRICGFGSEMKKLRREIERVVENDYRLKFRVPTEGELKQIRKIHRDMTSDERRLLRSTTESLNSFLSRVEAGDLSVENLPRQMRARLRSLLGQEDDGREDDE